MATACCPGFIGAWLKPKPPNQNSPQYFIGDKGAMLHGYGSRAPGTRMVSGWYPDGHSVYSLIHMEVSWNGGTPKSSILVGFSITNQQFLGTPHLWKTPYGKNRFWPIPTPDTWNDPNELIDIFGASSKNWSAGCIFQFHRYFFQSLWLRLDYPLVN